MDDIKTIADIFLVFALGITGIASFFIGEIVYRKTSPKWSWFMKITGMVLLVLIPFRLFVIPN